MNREAALREKNGGPRWAILAACCYGMMTVSFVNAGHMFLLPSISHTLGWGEAAGGLFLSTAFWGMVATILIAGPLADRYGSRVLFVGSALCQSFGLLIVSSASSKLLIYTGTCLSSIGTGTVMALALPVGFALYPKARHAISNFLSSFCSVGAIVLVLLTVVLLDRSWTWRQVYRFLAVLVLPYGLVFLFLSPPDARCHGLEQLKVRQLIRRGPYRLMLFGVFLIGAAVVGVTGWVPLYIETVLRQTRHLAAAGVVLGAAVSTLGYWLNSGLSRRLGPRYLSLVGGLLAFAALLIAPLTMQPVLVVSCFALFSLGMAGLSPAILANCGDRYPAGGATMYSFLMAAGNAGAAVGPFMIGLVAQFSNLRIAMTAMAVGPAIAVVVLLILLPRRRKN